MNHYQEAARTAMARKDYDTALQNYNKAIGRAQSATLYDARAACHVKLNDLPSALKDAKQCIQLAKTDPIGYTRAGTILANMGKGSVALEVMAHGLRVVKHSGKSYEILQTTHNDLMNKIKPVTSIDPMTVLPRELAIMVLEHLDFRQCVNVCSVSKAWKLFIMSVPELWEHLDFSKARRKVKNAFVVGAIKAAQKKIKRATLNKMFDFEKALAMIIRNCTNLEGLVFLDVPALDPNLGDLLANARQLKSIHFPQAARQRSVYPVIRRLANQLEVIECTDAAAPTVSNLHGLVLPRVKKLTLGPLPDMTAVSLREMLPNIQDLRLNYPSNPSIPFQPGDFDLRGFEHLRTLQLAHFLFLGMDVKLPTNLKRLAVIDHPTISMNIDLAFAGGFMSNRTQWPRLLMPQLEEFKLELPQRRQIDFSTVHSNLLLFHGSIGSQARSSLRWLEITGCDFTRCTPSLHGFEVFCSDARLAALQHLGWPLALGWDDSLVPIMVKNMPNLKSLDLSGTALTGVGVKAALEAVHLEELYLNNCDKLGRDAVQWARGKGIKVHSANLSMDQLKHERSIRY